MHESGSYRTCLVLLLRSCLCAFDDQFLCLQKKTGKAQLLVNRPKVLRLRRIRKGKHLQMLFIMFGHERHRR